MRNTISAALTVGLIVGLGTVASADQVTFDFNPVDFLDFRHHSEGAATDGGMFRLHETGGLSGTPTHDSWDPTGWATLDALRASLDDSPEAEGIGYFQVFLLHAPNPTSSVSIWGQTLTADPLTAPSGTAPAGWQPTGATDTGGAWIYQWEADSPDSYVRPGEDFGNFSLTFTANETVTAGSDHTLWFGGDNYPGFTPAIEFGTFPGGFPASTPAAGVGSAFESTLSVTAVPEPGIIAQLLGLGILAAGIGWWRRRSRRRA